MADEKKPCIAIAMPIADMIHPDTYRSILRLDIPRPFHTLDVRDHPVEAARNEIVGRAFAVNDSVKNGADMPAITHILWIDDDMVFPADALQRLLAHDKAVVGGLCHNRRAPYMPIVLYQGPNPDGGGRKPYVYDYDFARGLVEVDATGAAFILVKMEVYEAIEKKFATPGEGPYTQRGSGEDVSFCERAKECGFPTYVDTTLEIGHIGEVIVTSDFARRNRDAEYNPYVRNVIAQGEPAASIIIPTYDQKPAWLREAVQSAISQTVPVEIIVVDNGSTKCLWCEAPRPFPSVLGMAEHPRHGACSPACPGAPAHDHLKLLRLEKNVGSPWPALNAGIRAMSTNWFCWLSSDDAYYPKKVEKQLRSMHAAHAHASFHAYSSLTKTGESLNIPVPGWRSMAEQQKALSAGCYINGLTTMIEKSILDEVGGFDESFSISSDWDLWNKIAQKTFWLPIPEALAMRRDFDNASTRYLNDSARRELWIAEDTRIRGLYGGVR